MEPQCLLFFVGMKLQHFSVQLRGIAVLKTYSYDLTTNKKKRDLFIAPHSMKSSSRGSFESLEVPGMVCTLILIGVSPLSQ